ncbi:RIP metalloprotease RseP [Selenihalanaerobacter shriftii]|uniref:Zinc metalloprotease n=1 Tax=Selenihalanaerobacter shriftii TaxID=142842 RepID=A0A1T4MDI0_9FIRM|nr:RIP metalloprotease RseP [Selenihalanaerobacter shriftii]SJZ64993.1 regulator of sigma E protease [Selenihalanaerobacter shriftii]
MLTTIISFIIVISILVFVHEFGHFIVAKKTGVLVEEFAVGMGPQIIGKQRGETLYSIRLLPLGGYCKMTGEFPVDDEDEIEDVEHYQQAYENERCLFQKSVFERAAVIFTGPLMNFILAMVVFSLIFAIFGVPVSGSSSTVIGTILPDRPAQKAGLQANDKILSVNKEGVDNWSELAKKINNHPGEELTLTVKRNGNIEKIKVTPKKDPKRDVGLIGIAPRLIREKVGIFTSIKYGFKQTIGVTVGIISGVWRMITGQMAPEVAGPVKIAQIVGDAAKASILKVLNLMAILSVNLGILNLLPFPALDGGRLAFLGIELIRGKEIDPEKEGFVHFVGLVLLLALMVVIVYKDIVNIF